MEPACAVLEISPSLYYAAKKREENPSARDVRDEELKREIVRVRERRGRKLYGARKIWHELNRDGVVIARCTVERLMGELGIAGARTRRKRPRTTVPGPPGQPRPSDLLERDFTASAPNRRWVADITYVETAGGFVYTSFILDLFSRMIVGWQVSDTLRAELALDALEMAVWSRGDRMDGQLIHHSDRGCSMHRSAMLSGLARSVPSGRSAGKVILMITPSRNHLTVFTRKSSSSGKDRGVVPRMSCWLRLNGSTGIAVNICIPHASICRRRNSRQITTRNSKAW